MNVSLFDITTRELICASVSANMAEHASPRARAAGFWALVLGCTSFLFQGRELIPGVNYTWNDMSLVSAILAVVYGFIISRDGQTRPLGMAGGTLGAVMLFDKLLLHEFQAAVRDINYILPEIMNAEAIFIFGLIVASFYFVVFKPMRDEK
jgi:hypothetical protein